MKRFSFVALAALLPILLAASASLRVQVVTIDTSPAGRRQVMDGFGTCLSGSEGQQGWWQQLYFDDLGGSGPTSALTQFARATAAYVRGFQNTCQVQFYSLCFQNELNFEEFYNSCTYPLSFQYITALKAIRAEFDRYPDLASIRLMGPEDLLGGDPYGMWQYGGGSNPIHKNLQFLQNIAADPTAASALSFFCIHGYANDGVTASGATPTQWNWWLNGWTTSPAAGIPSNVKGTAAYGKKSWMTETSGESADWLAPAGSFPNQGAWSIALKIHQALTAGQQCAWAYWQFTNAASVQLQAPPLPAGLASFQSFTSDANALWVSNSVPIVNGTAALTVPGYGICTLYGQAAVRSIPPAITQLPQSTNVVAGAKAQFTCAVTGDAPLSYQWLFDNLPIPGATGTVLTMTNVQPFQAGQYTVLVTNAAGSITSFSAALGVSGSPTVTLITPKLTATSSNGQVQITFQANPGRIYSWQVSTNLTSWSVLTSFVSGASLARLAIPLSPTPPIRYYRVSSP